MTKPNRQRRTKQQQPGVVLSLFPGIGLLDRAFEQENFCVVRGPDLLWGGNIRRFHPPAGACWGIIAGSPCQDFSQARRARPSGIGKAMLKEFARVVAEAQPAWWLLENVPRVPDVVVAGYSHQRIDVNQGWYSGVSRLRHVQFGSSDSRSIHVARGEPVRGAERAALACDGRSFAELCRLQGLPDDFSLPGFTVEAAKRAVGNGVPLVMGRVLAQAIRRSYGLHVASEPRFDPRAIDTRICQCGCGRPVRGRKRYDSAACRKRAQRRRERSHKLDS